MEPVKKAYKSPRQVESQKELRMIEKIQRHKRKQTDIETDKRKDRLTNKNAGVNTVMQITAGYMQVYKRTLNYYKSSFCLQCRVYVL
jgi:hypothetical protein